MNDLVSAEHFHAKVTSDPSTYARTGYLGFIRRSDKMNQDGSECKHV